MFSGQLERSFRPSNEHQDVLLKTSITEELCCSFAYTAQRPWRSTKGHSECRIYFKHSSDVVADGTATTHSFVLFQLGDIVISILRRWLCRCRFCGKRVH